MLDLSRYRETLNSMDPVRLNGRVCQVVGAVVESLGPASRVGEICRIHTGRQRPPIPAEVLGFRGNRVLLMPLGGMEEIAHGDEVVLGVTHDPARREVFWAERGQGAFLNPSTSSGHCGSPILVSERPSLQASVVGFDMGYIDEWGRRNLELALGLWPGMQALRVMGSGALGLAYVAAGRLDIYFHHTLYPWDIAAGILLVEEAGGIVTDAGGGHITYHSPSIIAAGPSVHADFLKLTEGLPWRGR